MITAETVLLRLGLALLLGGIIGIEREYREHSAGLKTLALVSLGSALITIASAYGFEAVLPLSSEMRFDPSRVAAQIVSGIGFLGAGTILLRKDLIRGLTTSAAIWLVAGIGLACGAGLLAEAGFATVFALLLLIVIHPIERRLFPRRTTHRIRLRIAPSAPGPVLEQIYVTCRRVGLPLDTVEMRAGRRGEIVEVRCRTADKDLLVRVATALRTIAGVEAIRADLGGSRAHAGAGELDASPAPDTDSSELAGSRR